MALDGTKVFTNPGTLTFTPSGGAAVIGFTVEGFKLAVRNRNEPIVPEELGDTPLDYILLGGPVLLFGKAMQFEAATLRALADYAVSSTTLTWSTTHVGKKLSDLSLGTLSFVPDTQGHVQIDADRAVPVLAEEVPFEIDIRRRKAAEFAFCFAILPPAAGGTLFTVKPKP